MHVAGADRTDSLNMHTSYTIDIAIVTVWLYSGKLPCYYVHMK